MSSPNPYRSYFSDSETFTSKPSKKQRKLDCIKRKKDERRRSLYRRHLADVLNMSIDKVDERDVQAVWEMCEHTQEQDILLNDESASSSSLTSRRKVAGFISDFSDLNRLQLKEVVQAFVRKKKHNLENSQVIKSEEEDFERAHETVNKNLPMSNSGNYTYSSRLMGVSFSTSVNF